MIDIYLIRHGKASSGWDNLNPDLGIIGKKQSKKIATELLNIAKEPYDIFSSPLIRCCLLYTSPSPRDRTRSRMPSSA